jgi:hypothetical protein
MVLLRYPFEPEVLHDRRLGTSSTSKPGLHLTVFVRHKKANKPNGDESLLIGFVTVSGRFRNCYSSISKQAHSVGCGLFTIEAGNIILYSPESIFRYDYWHY